MAGLDTASVVAILATGVIFMGVLRMIFGKRNKSDVFDFERDHAQALSRAVYQGGRPMMKLSLSAQQIEKTCSSQVMQSTFLFVVRLAVARQSRCQIFWQAELDTIIPC